MLARLENFSLTEELNIWARRRAMKKRLLKKLIKSGQLSLAKPVIKIEPAVILEPEILVARPAALIETRKPIFIEPVVIGYRKRGIKETIIGAWRQDYTQIHWDLTFRSQNPV